MIKLPTMIILFIVVYNILTPEAPPEPTVHLPKWERFGTVERNYKKARLADMKRMMKIMKSYDEWSAFAKMTILNDPV
ncbi:unnamed protein product [Caenorhabditis brenneri]